MTDYTNPENLLTPVKAIRAKCLDCTGGQFSEIRLCPVHTCALHPYRMGHRPTADTWKNPPPRYEAAAHLPRDGKNPGASSGFSEPEALDGP